MVEIQIGGPFAQILEANRGRFNAKFAEARHFKPKLDAEAFKHHLRVVVAPIVEAVHRLAPDKAAEVANVLYDLSLDLVGQEFLGPESRYPHVSDGWSKVLPRLPRFIAEAPRLLAGSVTNALYNLSVTPGARPHEWAATMLGLADACPSVAVFLKMGQVAAWRAGLAHYRQGALEICAQFVSVDPTLARLALGLPANPDQNTPPITAILERLLADPWWRPTSNFQLPASNLQLQIVARVGAFRGFGGQFMSPPQVAGEGGQFVLREGDNYWLLTADAFGATLHRYSKPALKVKPAVPFHIDVNGKVTHGKHTRTFPELAQATSWAANSTTLAVTTALSHAVFLIALME